MLRKCFSQAAGVSSIYKQSALARSRPSRQPLGGAGGRAWWSLWPGAQAGPLGTGAWGKERGEGAEGGGAGGRHFLPSV